MVSQRIYGLLSALFLFSGNLHAQEYFQQEVNYTIKVKLDDVKHELDAEERIEYINNSPVALKEIYMHLWPNAYKNDNTALAKQLLESGNTKFRYSREEDRGYISNLDFKVDGEPVSYLPDSTNIDVGKLVLNKEVAPGQKIIITTPFHVKIPIGTFSRLGHIDQQYQVTQWYPKPAVYDKNGWNAMPYLNQGEFYSEFGSFDVFITLPENYVVGATGDLVDGEKETAWLNEKVKVTQARSDFDKNDDAFPASSPVLKTLHYHQSKVHDFAWFADKRYHVLKSEVELPQSKRKVTTWVMFTNAEAALWKNSSSYVNDALYYYSLWNGDYPYNQYTAVDGALSAGGGMEYPNVTVIGTSGNAVVLETTIMHEVGHSWFYGILGSNERLHPWMDEGINSFNELRYMRTKYPNLRLLDEFLPRSSGKLFDIGQYKQKTQYELAYLVNARRNLDQPVELPAPQYMQLNYAGIVYSKTALIFDYLMAYLGEEKMNSIMHSYFESFKFRHPQPEDIRALFEKETGKSLTWFFDGLIRSTKKLDYKIVSVKEGKELNEVTVKNVNVIKGPVCISGMKDKKVVVNVWYDGFYGKQKLGFPPGSYDAYRIDPMLQMPEVNRKNNTIRTKGLFRKVEPLRLQFLGSMENPDRTQVCYTPVVGYNRNNGVMPGIAVYNVPFPQKKFEYLLMPLYATGNNRLAGQATVAYNWFPNNDFQNIHLAYSASKYSFDKFTDAFSGKQRFLEFIKLTPELEVEFRNKNPRSPVKQSSKLRSVNINRTFVVYGTDGSSQLAHLYQQFNELSYQLVSSAVMHPLSLKSVLQQHETFLKASGEFNYRFPYRKKGKGADIRLFAGKFIYNYRKAGDQYGFGMSGGSDYTFDQVLMGRNANAGLFNNQLIPTEGGFKHQTDLAFAQNWLLSMHARTTVPKLPLAVYVSAGITDVKNSFRYESGVALIIIPKIFEVYFPAYVSSSLPATSYGDKIRFALNLNLIKPFDFARSFTL